MEHTASVLDIEYFIEKYGNGKNLKLLDVGCADGRKVLNFLDKNAFKNIIYVGLDSVYWDEDKNLRPLSSKNKTFVYGDACHLPFSDEEFDLIVLSHVFEHIGNSEKLCAELKRVAKKDGKILVIVPLEKGGLVGFINRYRNLWKYLRILLANLRIKDYRPVSPHLQYMSYEEYESFFKARFNIVESYGRGSFGMLAISVLHENLMGFARQRINLMELVKKNFSKFFNNVYRKSKYFKIDATFILEPKHRSFPA